jgi:hypothetical protein
MKIRQAENNIAYAEVIKRLLSQLPETSEVYKLEQSKWGAEPIAPDVVYGSIFSGFLRRVVLEGAREANQSRSEIIRRSFEMIEDITQSADFQTPCLAEVSVLETLLGHDKEDWQRFSP